MGLCLNLVLSRFVRTRWSLSRGCGVAMKTLIMILTATALATAHSVAIRVSPIGHMVPKNSTVSVTCLVDRNANNRWLEAGLAFEGGIVFNPTGRQIDGEQSPRMFGPFYFEHVPCGIDQAYCIVTDNHNLIVDSARAKLTVVGCDDGGH